MAYPPFYSFHHQPGVINFIHLCSPSPHLHYQDLIPPLPYSQPQHPDPSANVKSLLHQILHSQQTLQHTLSAFATDVSNLSTKLTPTTFTHTNVTFPFVTPISSLNPQPQINHPLALSSHSPSQEPLHLAALCLNNDSQSLFSSPTLKAETETGKSKKLVAYGSNVSTTANGRSQEITAAEENSLEAEPHPDPPSEFQMLPTFAPFTKTLSALTPPLDGVPTIKLSGWKNRFDFFFLTPDSICFSCLEFELFALATTRKSPEKMMVNTTSAAVPQRVSFVFYSGGTPIVTVRSVHRNHREFQKTVARTITMAAPPPPRSTFVFDPDGDHDFQSLVFCLDLLRFCSILQSFLNLEWETMHSPWPRSLMRYLPTPSPREAALFLEMIWEPQIRVLHLAQIIGFEGLAEDLMLGLKMIRSSLAPNGPWLGWIEWAFAFIEWIISLANRLLLNCNAPPSLKLLHRLILLGCTILFWVWTSIHLEKGVFARPMECYGPSPSIQYQALVMEWSRSF